ncbi:MAG: heavy metal translocating P-type ATPase [Steroidobacteraceae bacterium]
MNDSTGACFHCGEPVPPGTRFLASIDGGKRACCCPGCVAAVELVSDAGLADYYRLRSAPAPTPAALVQRAYAHFDGDAVRDRCTTDAGEGRRAVNLLIEGLRCAACVWLIERRVGRLKGVDGLDVNPATARARVVFDPAVAPLSLVLESLAELGYRPLVLGSADSLAAAARERRDALKRLAVAGFGMMQVMMFAVALYYGSATGIDAVMSDFLRGVSLVVTAPVLFYSGWPILTGALRDLRERSIGMDVPIALGLVLACAASAWNTATHQGQVYFDSVTMFVFFLLVGRFVEMTSRHQAASVGEALARARPAAALRCSSAGPERVDTAEVAVGDELLVQHGEVFPSDGVLADAATSVDEALLTGEARTVPKRTGDALIGGSINRGPGVRMRVTAVGEATTLSATVRLLERALAERPRFARLADAWARRFTVWILCGAAAVAAFWIAVDPARAFEATLAVLVITCPCALSLATPAAFAAATSRLAQQGLLVTRADAIETLASVDRVVFDKTGTLTRGEPSLVRVAPLSELAGARCLALAAALERGSNHPLARAFANPANALPRVDEPEVVAGHGVAGIIEGVRYRIGQRAWVAGLVGDATAVPDEDAVFLGRAGTWLARFEFDDAVRPDAPAAVEALRRLGIESEIASGDTAERVGTVAAATGVTVFGARLTPEDKLARVRARRTEGHRVLMIGDGVNDAPVLGGASVSIAMAQGAALAQASADLVLVAPALTTIVDGIRLARRTLTIVRQNLLWAALYNLLAIPVAAAGLIPPWLAAIGMSASSLAVVLNSARLRRSAAARRASATPQPRRGLIPGSAG